MNSRVGYTLLEMLVAMAAASVLMAGMGSSIFIASQALDEENSLPRRQSEAAEVLSDLTVDIKHSLRYCERTATAVTFTVPDRDGNSLPETIRYAWSGTPGDPLTYEYNGSAPKTIAEDVHNFNLASMTRFMSAPVIPPDEGGNRLLLVVTDAGSLTAQETARQSLIESWGYTVTLIDDDDSQTNFDTALATNDVVFVSEEVSTSSLGTKLLGATIGVVNESATVASNLELVADHFDTISGTSFVIEDNTHYITQDFALGELTILTSSSQLLSKDDDLAAGIVGLGSQTGSPSFIELAVVEQGEALWGGGSAAGRRVQLPWGGSSFEFGFVNDDGKTIMQRAIVWAAGANVGGGPLLFVVTDAASPSTQETARQTLMESWGYTVTRISDDATTVEYADAMALNDVMYISQEITTHTIFSKLRDATIGIVNEEYLVSSDLGLGSGTGAGFYNDIDVLDNTHYITSEFSSGPLALFDPTYDIYTGTGFTLAPGAEVLGECGSITGLMALEKGGALWDSGTAAGRRVLVPWGDDFAALNTDGQTLMRRAIEWAGAGDPSPQQNLLFAVGFPGSLTTLDSGRKTLFESWGFTVTLIDDDEFAAAFSAALDATDVLYVGTSVTSSKLSGKVEDTTVGVVNELGLLIDNFGFAGGSTSETSQTLTIDDPAHYITSSLGSGAIQAFTSPQSMTIPGSTQAPDRHSLLSAEVSGNDPPALVVLETGAETYNGGTTSGRRVHMPFGGVETTQLTADGQTAMQRAIEWAAGLDSVGGGSGVIFEEFTEKKANNNATSLTIDLPSGTSEGDLLIACVATDADEASSLAAPAGWNVVDIGQEGGTMTFGVWWKLATASESSTQQFTWSTGQKGWGFIMRFTGHDATSPIDASATANGTSSSPTSPAVTTTVDNAMILRLGGFDNNKVTVGDTGLVGHTTITMDKSGNSGGNVSAGAGHTTLTTAGDSGTANFTLTGSEQYRTVTIAIKPTP